MKASLFSKALFALASLVLVSFASPSMAQSGAPTKSKYIELSPAQPTEPGKIEVQEFFSYACRILPCLGGCRIAARKNLVIGDAS